MAAVTFATSVQSVLTPVAYLMTFVALLAPGYVVAHALVRRCRFDSCVTVSLAFAVVALLGYAAFWLYFASPLAGRAFSAALLGAAVAAAWHLRRTGIAREDALQFALAFAAGAFSLAVLYLPSPAIDAAQRFFVQRPDDNLIPQLFAERLFWGVEPRHFLGEWLGSDRPPLQTGILLIVRPLFRMFGGPQIGYEVAGAIAQLGWVPAALALAVRAGFSQRRRAVMLAFLICSGFFVYNTVYTWPKLLDAGLCVAALVLALQASDRDADADASLVCAGVCAALALLAHGSAAFFIAPAFVVLVASRLIPARIGIVWAAVAALVLLAPWGAYQRFYDPPGDRLLKFHLAGITAVDPRPALPAIAQTYARTPVVQIAANKLANVRTALGAAPLLGTAAIGEPPNAVDEWRMFEREQITKALGVVNLGWLALPLILRRARPRRSVVPLLAIALASTLFWCAAMWGPGTTVTTHAAYATELLLFVVLAGALAELPAALWCAVLALQAADIAVTWIFGSLADAWRVAPTIDPVTALFGAASATAIAVLLRAYAGRTAAAREARP